jgi:hypothetical protein
VNFSRLAEKLKRSGVPYSGPDEPLAAYTDDEIEQGVPDDPEAPFEVSVKTAHKNVRESFATIEDAIADIVNTEGGTVEELSDEFSFEATEEHLGMTMDEIKSAFGR